MSQSINIAKDLSSAGDEYEHHFYGQNTVTCWLNFNESLIVLSILLATLSTNMMKCSHPYRSKFIDSTPCSKIVNQSSFTRKTGRI